MVKFIYALIVSCLLCWNAAGVTAEDITNPRDNGDSLRGPTLQDRLEKGLKARRPQEFAFVAKVVEHVDEGRLPRKLVDSTFFWARNQPHHPFQYFEKALKLRAKKIGVTI